MSRFGYILCSAVLLHGVLVFAAPRGKVAAVPVIPFSASAEIKAEIAKYSLSAYENGDLTNRKALFGGMTL